MVLLVWRKTKRGARVACFALCAAVCLVFARRSDLAQRELTIVLVPYYLLEVSKAKQQTASKDGKARALWQPRGLFLFCFSLIPCRLVPALSLRATPSAIPVRVALWRPAALPCLALSWCARTRHVLHHVPRKTADFGHKKSVESASRRRFLARQL